VVDWFNGFDRNGRMVGGSNVCSKDELGAYPPMPRSLATGDLSKDLDCAFKANGQRGPLMFAQSVGLMRDDDLRGCYILE
jgi:hypothetical protein